VVPDPDRESVSSDGATQTLPTSPARAAPAPFRT
jgi:hypothetical protein